MEFTHIANRTIEFITQTMDEQDRDCISDVDIGDGVVTIINKNGCFLINRQIYTNEMWFSSPISGPSRFKYQDHKWISSDGKNLLEMLASELNIPDINGKF